MEYSEEDIAKSIYCDIYDCDTCESVYNPLHRVAVGKGSVYTRE